MLCGNSFRSRHPRRLVRWAENNQYVGGLLSDALPLRVKYMLKTYPSLDPSRVYVTGYSMGSAATLRALNGEYDCYRWYLNDADDVPMVALAYTMNLQHALYPEYGKIAWEFFKHYRRDPKTGAIEYNPYAG